MIDSKKSKTIATIQPLKPIAVGFKEAGMMLGISGRTARRLHDSGEFPNAFGGKKKGPGKGRRLIPVADIEAYVKRQTRSA